MTINEVPFGSFFELRGIIFQRVNASSPYVAVNQTDFSCEVFRFNMGVRLLTASQTAEFIREKYISAVTEEVKENLNDQ